MTEAEWLAGQDTGAMLDHVQGRASDRKLRLLSVALWRLLDGGYGREAIEVAERYADGVGTKAALKRARQSVRAIRHGLPPDVGADGSWGAYWLAEVATSENAFAKLGDEFQRLLALGLLKLRAAEPPPLYATIVEIFGNPYRAISPDSARLDGGAVALAQSIYMERAFDLMPKLADLMQDHLEAKDLLAHFAEPVVHARGCWALDLILGRR